MNSSLEFSRVLSFDFSSGLFDERLDVVRRTCAGGARDFPAARKDGHRRNRSNPEAQRRESFNSSVFTLTTSSLPACRAATFCSSGATMRHGPHHGAQKSTTTGSDVAGDQRVEVRRGIDFDRECRRRKVGLARRTANSVAQPPVGEPVFLAALRARHDDALRIKVDGVHCSIVRGLRCRRVVAAAGGPFAFSRRRFGVLARGDLWRRRRLGPVDARGEQTDADRVGMGAVVGEQRVVVVMDEKVSRFARDQRRRRRIVRQAWPLGSRTPIFCHSDIGSATVMSRVA